MTNDYSIKADILPIRRNLMIVSFIIIFIVASHSKISHMAYPFFKIEPGYFTDELWMWILLLIFLFYWGYRYILALENHRDAIQQEYVGKFNRPISNFTPVSVHEKDIQNELKNESAIKVKFAREIEWKRSAKYYKYFCFPLYYIQSAKKGDLKYSIIYQMQSPIACKICAEGKFVLIWKLLKNRICVSYFWDYDFPLIMGWVAFICLLIKGVMSLNIDVQNIFLLVIEKIILAWRFFRDS